MKTRKTKQIRRLQHGTLWVPQGYRSPLTLREREQAVKFIKDNFQVALARALNLSRVSAPLAVFAGTGVNDHLNGIEKPASFIVKQAKQRAEIVQSLAKWKRTALADYEFAPGEGIYTDMNALRPDEILDNLHSIYVDQWDWERVITRGDRSVAFLKRLVRKIYAALRATEKRVCAQYRQLPAPSLPPTIHFVHTEQLEARYPDLSRRERENAICREKGAVFIIGIGAALRDGRPHDGRAADYDDWWTPSETGRSGLNGDLFVWYPTLECALELSSMGIRVDALSLRHQLRIRKEESKLKLAYHKRLLRGDLPPSVGGGIGQSRLCMFLLGQAHVGEVQVGLWPDPLRRACRKHGIQLL